MTFLLLLGAVFLLVLAGFIIVRMSSENHKVSQELKTLIRPLRRFETQGTPAQREFARKLFILLAEHRQNR